MPGSPATNTILPGTIPPPNTLFSSASDVGNLFSSLLFISFNEIVLLVLFSSDYNLSSHCYFLNCLFELILQQMYSIDCMMDIDLPISHFHTRILTEKRCLNFTHEIKLNDCTVYY